MTQMPFKFAVVAVANLGLIGCASRVTPAAETSARHHELRPPGPSAAALAFTPRLADDDVNLDREGRQTVAYAGYEQQVLSVTYTRQDDQQRWNANGRDQSEFERRSISTTVTVRGQ